jgi:hypothetical protein
VYGISKARLGWWVAGNIVVLIALPVAFALWIEGQVEGTVLNQEYNVRTGIVAFTISWGIFILFFNVTVALFLWLRGGQPRYGPKHRPFGH